MNLQQFEYILAVNQHRNFVKAADACFVTQATLSMMIKKLEDELEVKIFDRSRQPVLPTEAGQKVLAQARKIITETRRLSDIVLNEKNIVAGELRLGIIPTLAPYLLPLFLKKFLDQYPKVKLIIHEYTTDTIIQKLRLEELDVAILATPLHHPEIVEHALFNEQYLLYLGRDEKGYSKKYVMPDSIDVNRLWLLEEGHCMRTQILNLCELKKLHAYEENFHYSVGSIETLINMVDAMSGMTVIPELAAIKLSAAQKKRLRLFKAPVPVREISLVTTRNYVKANLMGLLKEHIVKCLPGELHKKVKGDILEIS